MPTVIFGSTEAGDLHWISPLIGAAVFAAEAFLILQFNYPSLSIGDTYLQCLTEMICSGV